LFYVRIGNPEIKIGYIPRLKIIHGIYLGNIIVENVSGKAYLNVISTLDEDVEVQVPTLHIKPLDKLFDDHESNMKMQNNRGKGTNIQPTDLEDNERTTHFSYGNWVPVKLAENVLCCSL